MNGADGAGGGPVSGFGCGASVVDENLTNEMNHRGFPSEESAVVLLLLLKQNIGVHLDQIFLILCKTKFRTEHQTLWFHACLEPKKWRSHQMQIVFASQLNQLNELDLLRRCDFLLQAKCEQIPVAEVGRKTKQQRCVFCAMI